MNTIKLFNDDGSEYLPKHSKASPIPFVPGTPGLILVGLSTSKKAMPLNKIPDMLATYMNKFPAMIQATPDVSVGLCVYDEDKQGWTPLTTDMLHGTADR